MVTAAVRFKESPVDVAHWNFESACSRIALDADLKTLLAHAYRELTLTLPVRMDDGRLRMFEATRLLHSNSRGPAIGTLRIVPGADSDLASALATAATWTASCVGVPFGGACGVINADPASLSARELDLLLRRFASRTHVVLGPYQDVVLANQEREAAVLLDEYSALRGFTPACVAGKSAEQGGAAHTRKAQPRAAALVLREAVLRFGRDLEGLRVAIYATRDTAAEFLAEFGSIGCSVVALTDGKTSALDERGLNALAISESIHQNGSVSAMATPPESVLGAACDVLVLAAEECALHATNAGRVRASIILEAAPLSVTPSADVVLRQQRAGVIPDLLGASGSIIAAHTEWSANLEKKQVLPREIEADLERTIPRAVETVFERSKKDRTSLRSAAYCIAVERVARTERLRGI